MWLLQSVEDGGEFWLLDVNGSFVNVDVNSTFVSVDVSGSFVTVAAWQLQQVPSVDNVTEVPVNRK